MLTMGSKAGHVSRTVEFNNDAVSLRNVTLLLTVKKAGISLKEEDEKENDVLGTIELKASDLRRNSKKTWTIPSQ